MNEVNTMKKALLFSRSPVLLAQGSSHMLNGTYLEGISDPAGKVFENKRNKLYKNNGDGTFTELSGEAGVDNSNWSMAAGAIDIDNDGDQDLYTQTT